jgi:hypothetical protein
MPLFNEILQGRQQTLLTKLFAMIGGSPAPQLAPEVQAGLDLTDYRRDTDLLQSVVWYRAGESAAAVAAQYSRVSLRNGAGILGVPNQLVVITSIEVSCVANSLVYLQRVSPPALPVSQNNRNTDTRFDNTANGRLSPHDLVFGASATAPANGQILSVWRTLAAQTYIFPVNIVLGQGPTNGCIEVVQGTVNTALDVSFEYYARTIAPSETAP